MSKTVNEILTNDTNKLMEACMKDLTINMNEEVAALVSVHDIKCMLKAVDARVYVSELDMDIPRLRLLLKRARAAEAAKDRVVVEWESCVSDMDDDYDDFDARLAAVRAA